MAIWAGTPLALDSRNILPGCIDCRAMLLYLLRIYSAGNSGRRTFAAVFRDSVHLTSEQGARTKFDLRLFSPLRSQHYQESIMGFATNAIHVGQERDPATGA